MQVIAQPFIWESVGRRNSIINYFSYFDWQREHIEEGVRQAEAGEFASESEVAEAFRKWRE